MPCGAAVQRGCLVGRSMWWLLLRPLLVHRRREKVGCHEDSRGDAARGGNAAAGTPQGGGEEDRRWDAAGRAARGGWRCTAAGTLHGEGAPPPGRRREGGGASPLGEGRPAAGRVPVAVGWPDRTADLFFLSGVARSGAREWSERGRAFVFREDQVLRLDDFHKKKGTMEELIR